jgi:hypothetical protein
MGINGGVGKVPNPKNIAPTMPDNNKLLDLAFM